MSMAPRFLVTAMLILVAAMPARRSAADEPLRLLLDWKAGAERGGFYQAQALGLYKKYGLAVTIVQGGPGVNSQQMIAAGAVDIALGSNDFAALNLVRAGADVRAVAALFQKDPQVLMTHPRDDIKSLSDMKGKPIMISSMAVTSYWSWLRAAYGFSDSQIRKFTNNDGPFLADTSAIEQGYVTSSPYLIEKAGVKPNVYLLADNGYPSYAGLILVPQALIDRKPAVVQAFVDATIEGWQSFLDGDPAPAFALINAENPDMTDEIDAYARLKLKDYGILQGGDAQRLGIGAMTAERWKQFFDAMVTAKVYPADLDYTKAFTLDFVTKGTTAR
jgi:NitT/TauT family transport system substrate-binding protein